MDKTTNEIYLRISSKCPIPQNLELGADVAFIVRGGVVKKEETDNQNGTLDVTYTVKPVTAEEYEAK